MLTWHPFIGRFHTHRSMLIILMNKTRVGAKTTGNISTGDKCIVRNGQVLEYEEDLPPSRVSPYILENRRHRFGKDPTLPIDCFHFRERLIRFVIWQLFFHCKGFLWGTPVLHQSWFSHSCSSYCFNHFEDCV